MIRSRSSTDATWSSQSKRGLKRLRFFCTRQGRVSRLPFTGGARVKHNTVMTEESDAPEPGSSPEALPDGTLVFEQPLNERCAPSYAWTFSTARRCTTTRWRVSGGSRAAMGSLIDILAISTRGDVRSDVLKELERQLTTLTEFQAKPGVDVSRLKTLMTNLVRLRTDLQNAGLTFLQPLRDSEFLSAIKHRSAIPAARASSTCRTITSGSRSRTKPAPAPSTNGGLAAPPLRRGGRAPVAHPPERPRPPGNRARRHLQHHLRPRQPVATPAHLDPRRRRPLPPRSAAATTAATCASSPGKASQHAPRKPRSMFPSFSAAAPDEPPGQMPDVSSGDRQGDVAVPAVLQ